MEYFWSPLVFDPRYIPREDHHSLVTSTGFPWSPASGACTHYHRSLTSRSRDCNCIPLCSIPHLILETKRSNTVNTEANISLLRVHFKIGFFQRWFCFTKPKVRGIMYKVTNRTTCWESSQENAQLVKAPKQYMIPASQNFCRSGQPNASLKRSHYSTVSYR